MKKKSRNLKFTVFHGEEAKKILIIIMIIFSQCIFFSSDSFHLSSMEIKGLSRLNGKDIAEKSSPYWKNKHILFVNAKAIKEKLAGISWVEDSKIKKEYPNKMVLDVKERTLAAAVASESDSSQWYGCDKDGCILAKFSKGEEKQFPKILLKGKITANSKADKSIIGKALQINGLMGDSERKNIKRYRIDSIGAVSFEYVCEPGGDFEVMLGKCPDLEDSKDRIKTFKAMMVQLKKEDYCRIEYIDLRYKNSFLGLKTYSQKQKSNDAEPPKKEDGQQADSQPADGGADSNEQE